MGNFKYSIQYIDQVDPEHFSEMKEFIRQEKKGKFNVNNERMVNSFYLSRMALVNCLLQEGKSVDIRDP